MTREDRDLARSFLLGRWLFLRGVGLAYLFAFLSLAFQIEGLIGEEGILPVKPFLEAVKNSFGFARFWRVPTLFWIGAGDGVLVFACALGALASIAVIAGFLHRPALLLAWVLYLSISSVGRSFLAFQWDILLLEVGLASLLIAPRGLFPRLSEQRPPHRLGLLVLQVILFKLMFSSGLVKLKSGDETWADLTALLYHYETQPLPTWLGWYAHQLPAWFQNTSVAGVFLIQLVVPFGVFGPRLVRRVAVALLTALQLLIALTGNYCYFNLLAVALCLLLLDDALLSRFLPEERPEVSSKVPATVRRAVLIGGASVLLFMNGLVLTRTTTGYVLPDLVADLFDGVSQFRSVNGYGLFAVMTTSRPEIIVEGSEDGTRWKEYVFPHKPGPLDRSPDFVAPHQPRLDWQMWFAALGTFRRNPWFGVLLVRLLEGSPAVLDLLEKNPFPKGPPKYVRARLYRYRFTSFEERKKTGRWWKRERTGEYMPAFSLEDVGPQR